MYELQKFKLPNPLLGANFSTFRPVHCFRFLNLFSFGVGGFLVVRLVVEFAERVVSCSVCFFSNNKLCMFYQNLALSYQLHL